VSAPPIQWYPGHIAKAEQQLKRNLEKVDLVIEVRDARIPLATGHPHLNRWLKGKQHLLVINRRDMVTKEAWAAWEQWFKAKGQRTVWCDAKAGTGVKQVQQAAIRAGDQLNERRRNRGMRPRAVRALTLGFPQCGEVGLDQSVGEKKGGRQCSAGGCHPHLALGAAWPRFRPARCSWCSSTPVG
jgi:ribosome biogenesis GTPase A